MSELRHLISFGWIDADGNFVSTNGLNHYTHAFQYCHDNNIAIDGNFPKDTLLELNWLKLNNPHCVEFSGDEITPKQYETWIRVMAEYYRQFKPMMNPSFEIILFFTDSLSTPEWQKTVASFVKEFGTPELRDKFYSYLLGEIDEWEKK